MSTKAPGDAFTNRLQPATEISGLDGHCPIAEMHLRSRLAAAAFTVQRDVERALRYAPQLHAEVARFAAFHLLSALGYFCSVFDHDFSVPLLRFSMHFP